MRGFGGGSCGLLLPAVALLLSNVTASRAWMELDSEARAQLARLQALRKHRGLLYLLYGGPESAFPCPAPPRALLAWLPGGVRCGEGAGTALLFSAFAPALPTLFPSSSGYSETCLGLGGAPVPEAKHGTLQRCSTLLPLVPGALSNCRSRAFAKGIASFCLSLGFAVCYTLEVKCILLLGALRCPCPPLPAGAILASACSLPSSVPAPASCHLSPFSPDATQQPPQAPLMPLPSPAHWVL